MERIITKRQKGWTMTEKMCGFCNKKFISAGWRKAKTCSYKCSNNLPKSRMKGKKMSEETKRKMSLGRKGKIPLNVLRGDFKGEKNHMWIKDRTKVKTGDRFLNDPLQKQWRRAVRDRDHWKCRIADKNCSGGLEAHHILPWSKFPELRYQINNGITLCHAHHPRKADDVAKLSPYFQKLVASLD